MKKILSFLFAMLLVSAFVACGGEKEEGEEGVKPETPASTVDNCATENLAPGENADLCKANS